MHGHEVSKFITKVLPLNMNTAQARKVPREYPTSLQTIESLKLAMEDGFAKTNRDLFDRS
jgi:hypothetical protein